MGSDNLSGYANNDALNGGEGNDYSTGNVGNDAYVFGKNFGQDRGNNDDNAAGKTDRLQFTDVRSDQLCFRRPGSNLEISVIGYSDKVSVDDWFSGQTCRMKKFERLTIKH